MVAADRLAVEVDGHDVGLAQPALGAAGDGDRGVAVVEAAREVAAGRGRPAERGQLADVDDDFAGEFAQAVVVVGQGVAHGPEFTAVPLLGGSGHGRSHRGGSGLPCGGIPAAEDPVQRSEEHTSELQSLMRISYAVFFLKKQKKYK